MLLIFRRFSEYFKMEIDRKNKKLKITGSQTNYKETEQPWRLLWDRCEQHKKDFRKSNIGCKDCDEVAKVQDSYTQSLDDKKFAETFENQMKVYGYNLVKWE